MDLEPDERRADGEFGDPIRREIEDRRRVVVERLFRVEQADEARDRQEQRDAPVGVRAEAAAQHRGPQREQAGQHRRPDQIELLLDRQRPHVQERLVDRVRVEIAALLVEADVGDEESRADQRVGERLEILRRQHEDGDDQGGGEHDEQRRDRRRARRM